MKKKLLALLLVVSLIASLAVGLAACSKDDEDDNKVSNTEAIGTAVAMLATSAGTGSAAGDGETAQEGLNLNFGTSLSASATLASSAFSACKTYLDKALESYVELASKVAEENAVTVTEITNTSTVPQLALIKTVLEVKVTTEGQNNTDVTTTYRVYIDAYKGESTKVDVNTEEGSYNVDIFVTDANDEIITEITGTAKYDASVETTKFSLDIQGFGMTMKNCDVYATEDGGIVAELKFDLETKDPNTQEVLMSINAGAKIEIGKLSDTQYGVKVDVDATVEVEETEINVVVATYNVKPEVKIDIDFDVIANKAADAKYDFTLDGDADITINVALQQGTDATFNKSFKAEAELDGNANYAYDAQSQSMELTFALNGNVTLASNAQ